MLPIEALYTPCHRIAMPLATRVHVSDGRAHLYSSDFTHINGVKQGSNMVTIYAPCIYWCHAFSYFVGFQCEMSPLCHIGPYFCRHSLVQVTLCFCFILWAVSVACLICVLFILYPLNITPLLPQQKAKWMQCPCKYRYPLQIWLRHKRHSMVCPIYKNYTYVRWDFFCTRVIYS